MDIMWATNEDEVVGMGEILTGIMCKDDHRV